MTPNEGVPGLWIIRGAARLVPLSRRAEWTREWEAEVVYAWRHRGDAGRETPMARTRLRLRVLMCVIDALTERKETMTMTGLGNDVRLAVRGLLRRPGFTAVAVLTLALGIGANTAVFTLVDGVLLRPLPYDGPEELVSLQHLGRDGQDELPISSGLYVLYREHARTLEGVAMHAQTAANLVTEGQAERVVGQSVTPSFFQVLGVSPALGRAFTSDEEEPGAEPVMILSHGLWRDRFGSDPGVVGATLDLGGTMTRVVGIMPPGFGHPDQEARFWIPMTVDEDAAPIAAFFAGGLARIAPGESVESVRTELSGMMGRLTELRPGDGGARFLTDVGLRSVVLPLKEALVGDVRTTLLVLLGTVGFVLLIACANVANLLLVRAEGRQRELALRVAVGAGRGHVVRAFMAESAALATVGAALGLALAWAAVRLTTRYIPSELPRMAEVHMDLRVLGFTLAVTVGCTVFFGLFPLLRYGSGNLAGQLREGGGARGGTDGRDRHRLRNGLVVSQMALALVLLVGSGLMLRSFMALRQVDPGFEREGVLTARITVPASEIEGWQETRTFFQTLVARLEDQPGVVAVGTVSGIPLGGGGVPFGGMAVEDHPRGPDELPIFAYVPQAGPGYFEAMGIDVLEGRGFRMGDGADEGRGAVVSRSFAQRWWPNASPLGRGIRYGAPDEEWYRIVGVVEDVIHPTLEEPSTEMVYFPTVTDGGQNGIGSARALDLVVRTAGDPVGVVPVLRRELESINPRIPLSNPRTMESVFATATARTSFTAAVLGAASGIALLLGLVGIYGVVSYVVSQRTREIGVRMALGASAPSVRSMVVRQGVAVAAVGVVIGLVAAGALSRVMASLLYGVTATDPVTYGAVAGVLVAVAAVASWLPALRAASVDPSRALRAE